MSRASLTKAFNVLVPLDSNVPIDLYNLKGVSLNSLHKGSLKYNV